VFHKIAPYAVEREVEDLVALVNSVGGPVFLFGSSSGAVLALDAANVLGPKVRKVRMAPVVKLLRLEHRNRIALGASSGPDTRPSGIAALARRTVQVPRPPDGLEYLGLALRCRRHEH
jgi:pimeloyl-ACP methyl ester carboxylesterase